MNSADKFRNIVREALRNFISETGLIPKGMEFECIGRKVVPGPEVKPLKLIAEITRIEIIFHK